MLYVFSDLLLLDAKNIMGSTMYSTDAQNKLEDLSGIVLKPGENPYEAFIQACDNKPVSVDISQAHTHLSYSHGARTLKLMLILPF